MNEQTTDKEMQTILVADDEKDLREALLTILSVEGFKVLSAEDGMQAYEIAIKEKPDLILLDLMMPGIGGKEVLAKLKEDEWGKNAKVLILTALSDLESLSEILAQGGFDYLVKSDWKLEDIVRKVREKLAE